MVIFSMIESWVLPKFPLFSFDLFFGGTGMWYQNSMSSDSMMIHWKSGKIIYNWNVDFQTSEYSMFYLILQEIQNIDGMFCYLRTLYLLIVHKALVFLLYFSVLYVHILYTNSIRGFWWISSDSLELLWPRTERNVFHLAVLT